MSFHTQCTHRAHITELACLNCLMGLPLTVASTTSTSPSLTNREESTTPHVVQLILGTNHMVIGIRDESSHVYTAPYYAHPKLSFGACPHYPQEDFIIFNARYDECCKINAAVTHLKDQSVCAELHRYRAMSSELDWLEQLLINLEAKWGQLAVQKLGTCYNKATKIWMLTFPFLSLPLFPHSHTCLFLYCVIARLLLLSSHLPKCM